LAWTSHAKKKHYLEHALKSADKDGFNLLLCHHPDFFIHAKPMGIDLMLAGHTHGGQIALEFAGMEFYPIDLFYKYPRGLFEEGKNHAQKLYVNLGIGITATPLRTVQAEVALITLEQS
jgi:predicted MPP superfamily phosphohydrolase